MSGRHGAEVHERDRPVVLVDHARLGLPCDDGAEDTFVHVLPLRNQLIWVNASPPAISTAHARPCTTGLLTSSATNSRRNALGTKYQAVGAPMTCSRSPCLRESTAARKTW